VATVAVLLATSSPFWTTLLILVLHRRWRGWQIGQPLTSAGELICWLRLLHRLQTDRRVRRRDRLRARLLRCQLRGLRRRYSGSGNLPIAVRRLHRLTLLLTAHLRCELASAHRRQLEQALVLIDVIGLHVPVEPTKAGRW